MAVKEVARLLRAAAAVNLVVEQLHEAALDQFPSPAYTTDARDWAAFPTAAGLRPKVWPELLPDRSAALGVENPTPQERWLGASVAEGLLELGETS